MVSLSSLCTRWDDEWTDQSNSCCGCYICNKPHDCRDDGSAECENIFRQNIAKKKMPPSLTWKHLVSIATTVPLLFFKYIACTTWRHQIKQNLAWHENKSMMFFRQTVARWALSSSKRQNNTPFFNALVRHRNFSIILFFMLITGAWPLLRGIAILAIARWRNRCRTA